MRPYDVWVTVKDPGGTGQTMAVVDTLARRNPKLKMLLVAEGKALETLADRKPVPASPNLRKEFGHPKVLLTSMCSGGGVGRDLVPFLRQDGAKVVAVQDFWGARLRTDWSNLMHRPDRILVNDEVGKSIVLDAWERYAPERVKITGFPLLDQYAHKDRKGEAHDALLRLGLSQHAQPLFFAGQGHGTTHALEALLGALEKIMHNFVLVPRPHPRTVNDFPSEVPRWQRLLSSYRGPIAVDWFNRVSPSQLVSACALQKGVVVSMYSSVLIEAAAARAPAVSILFPSGGERALKEESGSAEFPLATAGSVAVAHNDKSLAKLLQLAANGALDLSEAQQRQFPLDGKNTERAAQAVEECLAEC